MTHAELAQKIREAVYARASEEGGAISKEQMEDAIGRVLAVALPVAPPTVRSITAVEEAYSDDLFDAMILAMKTQTPAPAPNMGAFEVANRYEEWR